MSMVTFKMPKSEKGKAAGELASPSPGEDHTPPPTMYLEHKHLEQLGLKKLPSVGSTIHFHAVAHVGSTSEDQDRGDGGKRRSMRLHIHKMDMGDGKQSTGASEEDQEEQSKAGAKAEMDKALSKGAGSESAKKGKA